MAPELMKFAQLHQNKYNFPNQFFAALAKVRSTPVMGRCNHNLFGTPIISGLHETEVYAV